MSLSTCGHPTEKLRILSTCEKPLHTKLCNSTELAQAIAQANQGGNEEQKALLKQRLKTIPMF